MPLQLNGHMLVAAGKLQQAVTEAAVHAALIFDSLDINVGHHHLFVGNEPFALTQDGAILGDDTIASKNEISS